MRGFLKSETDRYRCASARSSERGQDVALSPSVAVTAYLEGFGGGGLCRAVLCGNMS